MKAAILKANKIIVVEDIPPPQIADQECLIKISHAGICSSDIFRSFENGAYHYPLIMGHELSGHIISIGNGVTELKIGQRVTIFPLKPCFKCSPCLRHDYAQCHNYSYHGSRCDGGFSEFIRVNSWNLLPIPDDVRLEDAALTEPMSVVLHAIRKSRITTTPQNNVLKVAILGAGFLGLLAIKILRRLRPSICITVYDRNDLKLDVAKKYGAKIVATANDAEWDAHLNINSSHYDLVFEFSGAPINFSRSIELTAHGGQIIWAGNITDQLCLSKKLISAILRKELQINGTWNSSFKSPTSDDWKDSLNLMREGINPSELISHWTNLDDLSNLIERMYLHKTTGPRFHHIKCVIKND